MANRHYLTVLFILNACCLLYSIYILLSHSTKLRSYDNGYISRTIGHTAIILARIPSVKVLKHYNSLVKVGINVFVMCDEEPSKYINYSNRILHVSNERLAQYGLSQNLVWDRTLVWLYNQSWIDYVWLIEDDVTWANARYVLEFFNLYANNSADLLSRNIIYINNQTRDWQGWPKTVLSLLPIEKWSGSLNMLSRMSYRLINAHRYYTTQLMNLKQQLNITKIDSNYYYQEFVIPTVANVFNLSMVAYSPSNMDVELVTLGEDNIRQSYAGGSRIFHPVKHDSLLLANVSL